MKAFARTGAAALVLTAATAALSVPAHAQAPFFQGKTIHVVVGFTPGGGYDTYARLLARHFSDNVPGKPTVVVENMPGAGSLTAVKWLDGPAPKDGTAITAFNPGLITQGMLDDKNKVNFLDYAWVGNAAKDQRVCYLWGGKGNKGIKTFEAFQAQKGWNFGTTGVGAANWVNQRTLQRVFNVDMKIIIGFPGSAEQRLAVERGELDGDCGSWTSISQDWRDNHLIFPIIKLSRELPPDAPKDVPWANDLAKSDEDRAVLNVINGAGEIGRPYVTSKKVPKAQLDILRASFDATMKDKSFLADAEKSQLPIDPMTATEVEDMLKQIYAAPAAAVQRAKAITE
ncbi:MAG TPA: hypothetical protein VGO34_09005 [Alphaproteobacteria bacterium]|jgi:tripartite-type tricarboxylate transporter receptor subunit TctC